MAAQTNFIDIATIWLHAGKGGDGAVSFHREKFVAAGGPDGGDGGRGGDVVFTVDDGTNTLLDFKNRRKFIAPSGVDGAGGKFAGKSGANLIIPVPRGTVLRDAETGLVVHDMSDGQPFVAARGGRGGWGNTHFATPTRQVPRFAKSGTKGEARTLTLELKMLADVGLVGYPNVGKSTLLSVVSAARPKIAGYHFTTLSPNLGVVRIYDRSFVMADIPGLIEGAADGAGLGHDFLRHIDRCRLILHLFDLSASERPDPAEDIETINRELARYSPELAQRPQILVATKTDLGYDEALCQKVAACAERHGSQLFLISAATGAGVDALMKAVAEALAKLPPLTTYEPEYVPAPEDGADGRTEVEVRDGVYYVTGEWLKRLCGNVNFDDYESLQYFQRVLKNAGVIQALEDAGVDEGDTVDIYGIQFDFLF